jgi:hypothetical protein
MTRKARFMDEEAFDDVHGFIHSLFSVGETLLHWLKTE